MPTRESATSALHFRKATAADAAGISRLVIRTLRETNASYYDEHVLASVIANFSAERVTARMVDRTTLVATMGHDLVGTASLHGAVVRSVFVAPDRQGRGIGAELMRRLFAIAGTLDIYRLTVPSSINAEGFYRRLGFEHLRDEFEGAERMILMSKMLRPATGRD
jgi:N-acetylglutamate synthase-like GNAT family acetyltransferase